MAVSKQDNKVTTIGITGTIGAGKSLLGNILEEQDIPVIDTDKIVHELLHLDQEVKEQIKANFPSVLTKLEGAHEEQIDRKKLAKIIFNDKEAKTKLESILHPKVRKVCGQRTSELANGIERPKIIATLVPLLFESQRQADYDQVWTVVCSEDILRQRLAKRDNLSSAEIDMRLASQMSQQEKAKRANTVLDNSKDKNHLREQVLRALAELDMAECSKSE